MHCFFMQAASCQSQEPVDQLQNTAVPLVWYKTPTDEMNDCGLRNDSLNGSANALNSNVTDGEDEDVLSSLLSTHSFTQNDASPYMLDNNGTGSEIVDVESVSRHLLGQICDVVNGCHLAHIGCGTINSGDKALRVHEVGVVETKNNVDISNYSQPVGAMNPYASHACRQQFAGSNDLACTCVICDRVNSILTRCGIRTDNICYAQNKCIPTATGTPRLQKRGLSVEYGSASKYSDLTSNTHDQANSISNSFRKRAAKKSYACDHCHLTFHNQSSLTTHVQTYCVVKRHANTSSSSCNTHAVNKLYECDHCHKTFLHQYSLTRHTQTHSIVKRHVAVDNSYECDVCHKTFLHQYSLTRHKVTHSVVKPYVCDSCHKSYFRLQDLQQHQRLHSGTSPYTCNICKKAFTRSSDLDRHKYRQHKCTHSGVRPYVCDR